MIMTEAPRIKSAERPSTGTHGSVRLASPKAVMIEAEVMSVTSIDGTSRDSRRVARSRSVTKATAARP
jgi:hypothetical protein